MDKADSVNILILGRNISKAIALLADVDNLEVFTLFL